MPQGKAEDRKVLVRNRRARHDYEILETHEAGLSLVGAEVKSLRDGRASLADAYGELRGTSIFLVGAQIEPWPFANQFNPDPRRDRRLLLHRQEIRRIAVKVRERGLTLVPLEIYLKGSHIKVELAVVKGKRLFEKRQAKRADEAKREIEAEASRRR